MGAGSTERRESVCVCRGWGGAQVMKRVHLRLEASKHVSPEQEKSPNPQLLLITYFLLSRLFPLLFLNCVYEKQNLNMKNRNEKEHDQVVYN